MTVCTLLHKHSPTVAAGLRNISKASFRSCRILSNTKSDQYFNQTCGHYITNKEAWQQERGETSCTPLVARMLRDTCDGYVKKIHVWMELFGVENVEKGRVFSANSGRNLLLLIVRIH